MYKFLKISKIYLIFLLNIFTLAAANPENFNNSEDHDISENIKINNKSLGEKIIFPEYQLEVILFKNNLAFNKEIFSEEPKVLNKTGTIDLRAKYVKPKFLLKSYEQLKHSKNYQVVFYAATKYKLLPSQRSKKFFITSANKNDNPEQVANAEIFNIVLSIFQIKNNFNLNFNGHVNNFSLNRSAKIRSKEVYYFDHPKFGALITIVELNKKLS